MAWADRQTGHGEAPAGREMGPVEMDLERLRDEDRFRHLRIAGRVVVEDGVRARNVVGEPERAVWIERLPPVHEDGHRHRVGVSRVELAGDLDADRLAAPAGARGGGGGRPEADDQVAARETPSLDDHGAPHLGRVDRQPLRDRRSRRRDRRRAGHRDEQTQDGCAHHPVHVCSLRFERWVGESCATGPREWDGRADCWRRYGPWWGGPSTSGVRALLRIDRERGDDQGQGERLVRSTPLDRYPFVPSSARRFRAVTK